MRCSAAFVCYVCWRLLRHWCGAVVATTMTTTTTSAATTTVSIWRRRARTITLAIPMAVWSMSHCTPTTITIRFNRVVPRPVIRLNRRRLALPLTTFVNLPFFSYVVLVELRCAVVCFHSSYDFFDRLECWSYGWRQCKQQRRSLYVNHSQFIVHKPLSTQSHLISLQLYTTHTYNRRYITTRRSIVDHRCRRLYRNSHSKRQRFCRDTIRSDASTRQWLRQRSRRQCSLVLLLLRHPSIYYCDKKLVFTQLQLPFFFQTYRNVTLYSILFQLFSLFTFIY
jgi:hypothetical protein